MFDASAALATSRAHQRLADLSDQERLDIKNKIRSSVMPWRGQFSPQLIEYLLEKHAPKQGFIGDPFCGSGTVLYEAAAHDMDAYAADINPAAVCLAEFAKICAISNRERITLISELREFFRKAMKFYNISAEGTITAAQAAAIMKMHVETDAGRCAARTLLMLAFGDQRTTTYKKLTKSMTSIESAISAAPHSNRSLIAKLCDARDLPLQDNSLDYIVTSPPYINVFNYHQNYRPIIESLGYKPLPIARAEIGSNRKFRPNRYMTVIQYCIDMTLCVEEARRILKPNAALTIILGRESNIRGVPFRNGDIIGAIISDGLGLPLKSWNERKFLNRFGETIFEDVITFTNCSSAASQSTAVGRAVGIEALRLAYEDAPKERKGEIRDAIEAGEDIIASPYVLREKKS